MLECGYFCYFAPSFNIVRNHSQQRNTGFHRQKLVVIPLKDSYLDLEFDAKQTNSNDNPVRTDISLVSLCPFALFCELKLTTS